MKKFIKRFIWLLGILSLIFFVLLIVAAVVGYQFYLNQNDIEDSSILEIHIPENISELAQPISTAESLIAGTSSSPSLRQLLSIIEFASTDPKIKAISLNGTSLISQTKAVEIHHTLKNFQESGKPVYAYGDYYTQGGYILASAADSIFLNPSGSPDLKGYSIILTYMKDFFEKYHIDMEIYVAGKYKSYVEAYNRNSSSPQNRAQYEMYLAQLLEELKDVVSSSRSINRNEVADIIQNNLAYNADASIELNLVDKLLYQSDYQVFLKEKFDLEKLHRVGISKYKQYVEFKQGSSKKANTAFVVIKGGISKEEGETSSDKLRGVFQEIRENKAINTMILRVDSPGGSAFASEEIWHEIELCKERGIKVISSVSSIAGSGGYYVMANSDHIFASPSSLTGSIGVYIAFPVFKNALEENFSLHFDEFTTGPFSMRTTGINELTAQQKEYYQRSTDDLYQKFIGRVASGRKLDKVYIDSIAQGQIYSGIRAESIGLVDSIMRLSEVLEFTENLIEGEMILEEYPKTKGSFLPDFSQYGVNSINPEQRVEEIILENYRDLKAGILETTPMARIPFFSVNY